MLLLGGLRRPRPSRSGLSRHQDVSLCQGGIGDHWAVEIHSSVESRLTMKQKMGLENKSREHGVSTLSLFLYVVNKL